MGVGKDTSRNQGTALFSGREGNREEKGHLLIRSLRPLASPPSLSEELGTTACLALGRTWKTRAWRESSSRPEERARPGGGAGAGLSGAVGGPHPRSSERRSQLPAPRGARGWAA